MIKTALKTLLFTTLISFAAILSAATITINTTSQRAPISPYIYGTDQQMEGDENLTCFRLGGNRMTGYNWENNASNAGSDYNQSSDDYMCYAIEYPLSTTECASEAGGVIDHWVDYSIAHNYKAIITLPMAGYVAADKNGTVSVAETAPSARWKQVVPAKGSAFAYPPDTSDNFVYDDEEVWHEVQKYGNASTPHGVMAYQLDNEADMWDSTHPRIHPTPVGAQELVTRSVSLASAIKNVDSNAQVFGPVFGDIWDEDAVGSTIDWPAIKSAGGYNWYVDYYLDKLSQASTAAGKRLLDAIDIHYYTESGEGLYPPFSYTTGCRVTNDTCTSAAAQLSRLQAPRTLWDPTYIENSSVGQWLQNDLPLLPKLQASIDQYYPGTKIAVTEHGFGGGGDYSGGICLADVLGVFGKYGVYVATMWKSGYGIYHSAAYKLYRNYNGSNATYGDTKVQCDSNDIPNMTTYASISGADESTLHIIVLNKAPTAQNATVNITTSGLSYASGEAWAFDSASASITARSAPVIAANSFTYSVPAYSAFHFILHSNATPTQTVNWTASPTFTRTASRTNTPNWTVTPTCTRTAAGTNTPNWTATISPTRTQTPTITQTLTAAPTAAASVVYDGDSAGAQLADGTVENNHVGAGGSMTEVAGGDPGNMMKLTFVNPNYWEQHVWTPNTGKNTGTNTYLVFNIKQDASSPNTIASFYITINWHADVQIDGSAYIVEGGAINTTWKTVRIPLSVLLNAGDTAINFIAFAAGGTANYTVDIDNMRMDTGAVTPTNTPVNTSTRTGTPSRTMTCSHTYTMTFTSSPTCTETPSVTESMTGTPPTSTVTLTITETSTDTDTYTTTQTPTVSPTITDTPIDTATYSVTQTRTPTPSRTGTPTRSRTCTPSLTRTITETATITPVLSPTDTQTPAQSSVLIINDIIVYPNPVIKGENTLRLRIDATMPLSSVEMKIYTVSFRKICDITWDAASITGNYDVSVAMDKLGNLADGTYFYVVFVKNSRGEETRSKAGEFMVLR